jgi:hypothetical protein
MFPGEMVLIEWFRCWNSLTTGAVGHSCHIQTILAGERAARLTPSKGRELGLDPKFPSALRMSHGATAHPLNASKNSLRLPEKRPMADK